MLHSNRYNQESGYGYLSVSFLLRFLESSQIYCLYKVPHQVVRLFIFNPHMFCTALNVHILCAFACERNRKGQDHAHFSKVCNFSHASVFIFFLK